MVGRLDDHAHRHPRGRGRGGARRGIAGRRVMARDEAAFVRVAGSQLDNSVVRSDPPIPNGPAVDSDDGPDARFSNSDRDPMPRDCGVTATRARIEGLTGRSRDLLDSSRQLMIEAYRTIEAADAGLSRHYDDGSEAEAAD